MTVRRAEPEPARNWPACLRTADSAKVKSGRQESVTGSIFLGSIETDGDLVIPTIRGSAFVNGESTLLFNPADPCRYGMK